MKTEELKEILHLHSLWLTGSNLGKRANLRNANLRDADLRNADLRNANLRDADLSSPRSLWNTIGNSKEIQTMQTPKYIIVIAGNLLQIGCEKHSIEEWLSFDNDIIYNMDSGALEWWVIWKPIIKEILECTLTKSNEQ